MQATIESGAGFALIIGPDPNKTPEQSARGLRPLVEANVPKTKEDYFAETGPCAPANRVNALWAEKAIQNQTNCTGDEAEAAAVLVFPELYASYWEVVFNPAKGE